MADEEESVDHIMEKQNLYTDNENEHEETEHEENEHDSDDAVDTTADFLKVFQGKTEFDSWEEFTTLFEEFQKETGSAFKPKSATSIEYANERRVKDKIPEQFVYQTVKMVCHHYGAPVKRESSAHKLKKYVGLGCEAMVHLRYKGGSLNIVTCNLEHRNHKLFTGNEIIRSVRSFSFTDDVDFLMAKVVFEHNPFATWNSEKEWLVLMEDLQNRDPRMKTVTTRVVKKRIRFLIDRYMVNSDGNPPLPDDEMGIVLYELAKAKKLAMEMREKQPKKRGRGRPRKILRVETDDEEIDESHMNFLDSPSISTGFKSSDKATNSITALCQAGTDVSHLLKYMQGKDEHDRMFRKQDLDMRRRDLEMRKKDLKAQIEKFEFERVERQAQLDVLKMQLDVLSKPRQLSHIIPASHILQGSHLLPASHILQGSHLLQDAKLEHDLSEYTIVVNNDQAFIAQ